MSRKPHNDRDINILKDLSKFLLSTKKDGRYRYQRIAKNAGVARCTVSKVVNGKADPTITTLLKILKEMNIELKLETRVKKWKLQGY